MPQEKQVQGAIFENFGGLMTNADPHDLGTRYAREQTNITCLTPGTLAVRKGHTAVDFSNEQASSAGSVLAMCRFDLPHTRFVVYFDSLGNLRAGRNPG